MGDSVNPPAGIQYRAQDHREEDIVKNLWSVQEAAASRGLPEMVYASRLVGADPSLVLWGGGNTSLKVEEEDFRGKRLRVLRIKGSGLDLKSLQPKDFAGVRLEDVLPLIERSDMTDEEIVEYVAHCLMSSKDPRPSIEVLLHAFIPHAAVIHTHPDAILTLTNNARGKQVVRDLFGDRVGWVPYLRPGFRLSKTVGRMAQLQLGMKAIVLEKHGLITWGATSHEAYLGTVDMISAAERAIEKALKSHIRPFGVERVPAVPKPELPKLLSMLQPILRGALSSKRRVVVSYDPSHEALEFAGSAQGRALSQAGPGTPDHLMAIKRMPMWVDLPPKREESLLRKAVEHAVAAYAQKYVKYVKGHADGKVPPADPTPRVVLVPGVGLFGVGRDIRAARIASEVYRHTMAIMKGGQALGGYRSISDQEAYDVEYWSMEMYRQALAPPETEYSRRIILITGAASGIGKGMALRFSEVGAQLVLADVDAEGVKALAQDINTRAGMERALGVRMDVGDEGSVAEGFAAAAAHFGGVDLVVSNAGVAVSAPVDQLKLEDWEKSFRVNGTGHFLVSREAVRMMRRQGIGGSLVYIASKNVLAPGKDFAAYSASKAAQTQLARIVAIENGRYGIRVNIVNPDAVFQDSKLWSPEVRRERAKAQGIRPEELEDHYRRRNLLGVTVEPRDVAEAVLFLASDRAGKTTGCLFPVDGGLREAFPR